MPNLSEMILWYLAFLAAIVTHEAAHAWAALHLGDKTASEGGQVTLDPTPHIRREPVGTVLVPIASFLLGGWMIGWASTPYDREWALHHPRSAALMALAGPLANLALVLASAFLIRLGMAFDIFFAPSQIGFAKLVASHLDGIWEGLAMLLSIFFSLNLILLIFNLLPFPPMDGSAIATLMMSRDAAQRFRGWIESPTVAFIGLMIAWNFFGKIFRTLHLLAVNLLYPGGGYH